MNTKETDFDNDELKEFHCCDCERTFDSIDDFESHMEHCDPQ